MFYDIFLKLCNDREISPSAAALEMGFTKAANTKWAAGKTPRDATLAKIAEYFNVPVDYLKGETDDRGQKNSPGQMTEAEIDNELVRIWNASSDEERGLILDMARMVRDRSKQK